MATTTVPADDYLHFADVQRRLKTMFTVSIFGGSAESDRAVDQDDRPREVVLLLPHRRHRDLAHRLRHHARH